MCFIMNLNPVEIVFILFYIKNVSTNREIKNLNVGTIDIDMISSSD